MKRLSSGRLLYIPSSLSHGSDKTHTAGDAYHRVQSDMHWREVPPIERMTPFTLTSREEQHDELRHCRQLQL